MLKRQEREPTLKIIFTFSKLSQIMFWGHLMPYLETTLSIFLKIPKVLSYITAYLVVKSIEKVLVKILSLRCEQSMTLPLRSETSFVLIIDDVGVCRNKLFTPISVVR